MKPTRSQLISVVEAVRHFREAKKRIDLQTRYGVTFFSENDVWLYDATLDTRVCDYCRTAEEIGEFRGNNLRLNFPALEIIDENTIHPHQHVSLGWVSAGEDTCRCLLKRLLTKQEPVTPKGA